MTSYTLDADDHVTLQSHRHWINFLPPVIGGAAALLMATATSYWAGHPPKFAAVALPRSIFEVTTWILFLVGVLVVVAGWWIYRRNLLVLTTNHLIKVEQNGLFARKTSQLSLDRVQDVNGSRSGLFGTMLDYGRVEVETASEQENFVFIQMPNPVGLASDLIKAHDRFTNRGGDGLGAHAPATEAAPSVVPASPAPTEPSPTPSQTEPIPVTPVAPPEPIIKSTTDPQPLEENETIKL